MNDQVKQSPFLFRRARRGGFTLPTVMIVSVIMLSLMTAALQIVGVTSNSLRSQYHQQLAREAAEAGAALAQRCIELGGGSWANPLRPGGDCNGLASQCTADYCWVAKTDTVRTTFSVAAPAPGASFEYVGTAELLQSGTTTVRETVTYRLKSTDGVRDMSWGQITVGCALASGKAYCWGSNSYRQIGDNSSVDRHVPTAVHAGAMPAGTVIEQVAGGGQHNCALTAADTVYCWGMNNHGQLGADPDSRLSGGVSVSNYYVSEPVAAARGAVPGGGVTIESLSSGGYFTCALASNGRVYCWGSNEQGQLGINSATPTISISPQLVVYGAMPAGAIKQLSAGVFHVCAVASNNRVYCWGWNLNGQLGDGSTTQRAAPVETALPPGVTAQQIAAGSDHTCALTSAGAVYCWGGNHQGQLGDSTTTDSTTPVVTQPGAIPAGPIKRIATGYYHTCAIASNDWVYCWGDNEHGKLGNNDPTHTDSSLPVAVAHGEIPGGVTVVDIVMGRDHTCALASNHKAYCWGHNGGGRLGNDSIVASDTPVEVHAPTASGSSSLLYY